MMKFFSLEVEKRWYDAIGEDLKTIEGRKGSPTWTQVEVGDVFTITSPKAAVGFLMQVNQIVSYPSIEEYLIQEGLRRTLPGVKTIVEGVQIYSQWWTPKEVEEYGILAFHLTPHVDTNY